MDRPQAETILLIEDEPAIADNVLYALQTEGFRTLSAALGRDGLELLRERSVQLVILDVGLPDGSGFEFCKQIRALSNVPVLFLTARGDEVDRVVGLEIGADDYVVKPFSPRELCARVKVILRRAAAQPALPAGASSDFVIDRERHRVRYLGSALELTRSEFQILVTLLERPERVLSRRQIMQRVWDVPDMSQERAVDTHIKAIRAKLRQVAPEREPIETHRGVGYSLKASVREL